MDFIISECIELGLDCNGNIIVENQENFQLASTIISPPAPGTQNDLGKFTKREIEENEC